MDITENLVDTLEMVVLERIDQIRDCLRRGGEVDLMDLIASLACPEYDGKYLSNEDHVGALACISAIAIHWLAHQKEDAV